MYTMLKGQEAAHSVMNSLPLDGFYSIQFRQIACWSHTEAQYGHVHTTSFSVRYLQASHDELYNDHVGNAIIAFCIHSL